MESDVATIAATRQAATAIIAANVARAISMIEAAVKDTDTKLIVLPEFALQGPPHTEMVLEWIEKACDTIPGKITEPLQALAKKHRIFIAGNQFETVEKWPGRFFNSCFLIDPNGEVILRFRRINTAVWPSPHDFMDDYIADVGFVGAFPVVDTELGRLGMIACGEIAVPEVARALMMNGAEVILHPTNEEFTPAQEAAKIARAAENMVYLVSANVAGPIGFSRDRSVKGGRSRIVDFRGNTLAYDTGAEANVGVTAEIDIQRLRVARNETSMGNTIARARWEMYRPVYEAATGYPPNQFLSVPMTDAKATVSLVESSIETLRNSGVIQPASA